MKIALLVIGMVFALTGLVWIGQGTGYFPYPEQSFMVRQTQWAVYGAALVIAGMAAVWLSRRR
jgi:hypothetical protein